jgi:hypothetical protein
VTACFEEIRTHASAAPAGVESWAVLDERLGYLADYARTVTGSDGAAVNILDGARERSVVVRPASVTSYPRATSLAEAVLARRPSLAFTAVADCRADSVLATNPWVDGTYETVRMYAVVPLVSRSGYLLGTLTVWARRPGVLDDHVKARLRIIGDAVLRRLEQRRGSRVA